MLFNINYFFGIGQQLLDVIFNCMTKWFGKLESLMQLTQTQTEAQTQTEDQIFDCFLAYDDTPEVSDVDGSY